MLISSVFALSNTLFTKERDVTYKRLLRGFLEYFDSRANDTSTGNKEYP